MSDQQQMPLHKWEIVSQGDRGENATTYRMPVPGGWLYRYQPNITSPPSSTCLIQPRSGATHRQRGGIRS